MKKMLAAVAAAVLATTSWAAEPKSSTNTERNLGSTEGKSATNPKKSSSLESKAGTADTKDLTAIKQVATDLAQAFNDNDAHAAAALFATNAVLINPQGKKASGREEIEQLIGEDMNNFMKGGNNTFSNITVKMVKPDVAFIDMDHNMSGAKASSDSENQTPTKIHVAGLVVKQGGKWQILEARPASVLEEQPTTSS